MVMSLWPTFSAHPIVTYLLLKDRQRHAQGPPIQAVDTLPQHQVGSFEEGSLPQADRLAAAAVCASPSL